MPVLTTPVGPIETLEWGEGDDLLLLLHAAAAGPGSLAGLAGALTRPGLRIVAPALHGYGATHVASDGDRIDAHITVARACIDAMPSGRRVVFGHSMGGLVALLARIPADALVVYEPIVIGLLRDDDPAEAADKAWDRGVVSFLEQSVRAGDPEPGVRHFVEAWNELTWPALPASVRARLVAAAPDLLGDIRAGSSRVLDPTLVTPPPLILQGGRSPRITARMTVRLVESVPGSRLVELAACGHMGPVQAPASVADALRDGGVLDGASP